MGILKISSKYNREISIALSAFLLMFLFRLSYGYFSPEATVRNSDFQSITSDSYPVKKNIASKKISYRSNSGVAHAIDQKYEKIATLESLTSSFDEHEAKVRQLIKSTDSIIQFETTSGLKANRNRSIRFQIGVPPENFDAAVSQMKSIGHIVRLDINKKDKTNEYKDLRAKKDSLLKIRSSLVALKQKGGRIDEYISLENRILEIEEKIQQLGLSLGEFDSENEFCTVDLTLRESRYGSISFLHRVKVALQWSVKYYFFLSLSIAILVAATNLIFILLKRYNFLK